MPPPTYFVLGGYVVKFRSIPCSPNKTRAAMTRTGRAVLPLLLILARHCHCHRPGARLLQIEPRTGHDPCPRLLRSFTMRCLTRLYSTLAMPAPPRPAQAARASRRALFGDPGLEEGLGDVDPRMRFQKDGNMWRHILAGANI